MRNGSTNAAWRTAVARVRADAGRARIVTGARAARPAAVLAARLAAAGVPARDGATVGNNGLGSFATVPLGRYDPRVVTGTRP